MVNASKLTLSCWWESATIPSFQKGPPQRRLHAYIKP